MIQRVIVIESHNAGLRSLVDRSPIFDTFIAIRYRTELFDADQLKDDSMHFICAPFGSAGDVHPFIGLALALKQRGHRVTLIVNGYFLETAEKYGLETREMGTREEFLNAANHPDLWKPLKAFPYIWKNMALPSIPKLFDLLTDMNQPGETVVISSCLGFGALLANEKHSIPLVTVNLQPAVIWSRYDPPTMPGGFGPRWMRNLQYWLGERFFIDPIVRPELNRIRGEMGLPPVRKITRWWHSKWCVACLFPDWYCPPQPDWPEHLIQTDFPLWDVSHEESLHPEAEAFLDAGDPPIAFTPGSANMFGREFFETAIDVCQSLGRRGLLLSRFAEHVPGSLPDTIRHFSYVPFGVLLPRTAAIVHHGGIGSTAQGLAAGVPQMIMALAHDQFDNGNRVRRLGAGDYLPEKKFRPRLVSRMLNELMSSAKVRQQCLETAKKMRSRDGLELTAKSIEAFSMQRLKV